MPNKVYAIIVIAAAFTLPNTALANDNCTPAKQLVSAAKAFYGNQPELTNLITPVLNVGLKGINGYPDPTHLLYRFEGFEKSMPIVDGLVKGLDGATEWSKKGELCSIYSNGPLGETEENVVSLSVSFGFPYRRKDGLFSVDEIKEGAKDGSKIIKGLAPTGLGFAAPNLKTLIITPAAETEEAPKLIFMKDGQPRDVQVSRLGPRQYIRLKDIKSAKVDRLKIEGPYRAAAFFKIDPDEIAAKEAERLEAISDKN